MEVAYVSLGSTQKDLQDSKLHIYQLHEELSMSHFPSCMEQEHELMDECIPEDKEDLLELMEHENLHVHEEGNDIEVVD